MVKLHVLVIDDEMGMRMGVARALRGFEVRLPEAPEPIQFTVEQAESGEDGLALIAQRTPDILLLDFKLPSMSGLDVLRALSDRRDAILTIMITAYASLDTAVTATKRGAYDFLAKPFTPEELKERLVKATKHIILQREARRLSAEKHQVRFQFISVLAEELKQPLAAVEAAIQAVRRRTLGDRIDPYDDALDHSLSRLVGMRKMVLDLLDMTRIESGQKVREFAALDLRELVTESLAAHQHEASARGITLSLSAPAVASFRGDREELLIVFNNLIDNAIKYNRQNGEVDVRLELRADGAAVIQVRDTGIGMTPDELSRVFKEFSRIHNDKTRGLLGSGLGLAMLKRVAALYQGDVQVASEPDRGSVFTVTLRAGSA